MTYAAETTAINIPLSPDLTPESESVKQGKDGVTTEYPLFLLMNL
jgi:hypothetical protein